MNGFAEWLTRLLIGRGRHVYLSTACLHGDHGYCESLSTFDGETKHPRRCKFCTAECVCRCHRERSNSEGG